MTDSPPAPSRSLAARIFLSPDEPRLRAGWRLLIHSLALVAAYFVFSFMLGGAILAYAAFSGQPIELDAVALSENPIVLFAGSIGMAFIATLVTWPARRFLDRRSFASLGLRWDRHALPDLVFGVWLGGLLMGLIYLFEWAVGWLTFEGWGWQTASNWAIWMLGTLIVYVAVGYYEELLSRGYHLQNLADGLNLPLGLVLSSAVFSLAHLTNPDAKLLSVIGIFAAGFFLAYGWIRTRQLWIPIGLHIGWNFFQGTVFGFPVSGLGGFHLIRQTVAGSQIITGGAFGPEAGLVGLAAMGVGAGLIWLYTRSRAMSV